MAATVWKGHLSFGLISIPVRLARAARPERVDLHQLYRERRASAPTATANVIQLPRREQQGRGAQRPLPEPEPEPEAPVARVRQSAVTQTGEQPIPAAEVLKGYEYAPDQWVLVDKEDLKRIAPATSKTIDIREFVRFSDVDPIYLETSYYMTPDHGGEKAYALLFEALRETAHAAIADIAMHGREHVLIVRAGRTGIIAHTMYYEDEIHREQEYRANLDLVTKREHELARVFIETLAAPFEPQKYRDAYRERLEQMIAAKVEGKEVVEAAPSPPPQAPDLTDMVAALEKSLQLVRKPPAAAERGQQPQRRKGRRGNA